MLLSALLTLATAAPADGVQPGFPAPEIAVKEWMNTKATTLAKEEGRVVVLEFWATW